MQIDMSGMWHFCKQTDTALFRIGSFVKVLANESAHALSAYYIRKCICTIWNRNIKETTHTIKENFGVGYKLYVVY